eukprot:427531_1
MASETNLIDKIDNGLQEHYERLGRKNNYTVIDEDTYLAISKFRKHVKSNMWDEEAVQSELNMNAADCLLCDFDEEFPLDPEITDEDLKIRKIFEILKQIAENGTYYPKKKQPPLTFNEDELGALVDDYWDQPDFEQRLEIVKMSLNGIFNDKQLSECVYKVLEDGFEEIEEVLEDLEEYDDCTIVF